MLDCIPAKLDCSWVMLVSSLVTQDCSPEMQGTYQETTD